MKTINKRLSIPSFALLIVISTLLIFTSCKKSVKKPEIVPPPAVKAQTDIIMGVDDAGDDGYWLGTVPSHLIDPMKELGADFLIHHYAPHTSVASQNKYVKDLTALFEKNDLSFLINTEVSNFVGQLVDDSGWSWFKGPNDTHRFTFRPELLKLLNASKAFKGVVYDEAAHMQINQNWVIVNDVKFDAPFLGNTDGLSFEQADALVNSNAKVLVNELKAEKTPYVLTEHVFPVLFHNYAKAGMTVSYKQLKESWAPIWAASAMGAALQYDSELWSCLDLWFLGVYPGHSVQALKNNLMFGYWMGNDRMYVENINYNGSLYKQINGPAGTKQNVLSEYGKTYKWFTHQYLAENRRGYTFRDVKPEIAIIRFDDTDFGIPPGRMYNLSDRPFGSNTLKFTAVNDNWMKIWNLVSQGVIPTPEHGISWLSYLPNTPYKSFAPMNGVVVFDQTVAKKHLETLKLAFLSGLKISPETLLALQELVQTKGLTVVSTPELAPNAIRMQYSGTGTQIITDGSTGGSWVLTDNFLDPAVKAKIKPLLGKENEMRYVFGNKEVTMKIDANDQLTVSVK